MVRRRKRKSRRRQEGRKILEHIPQFNLESGEEKSVTAARKYIHEQSIAPPALILVRRNEHTIDRFFWAEKGLFGAQYVEENHFLFPSLKSLLESEKGEKSSKASTKSSRSATAKTASIAAAR
ncbi:MAG: DUF3155 domain-containing protein [Synechococcaceae cyanobacterium SM2_3_1]|nr:DUF3155 domain-containing protein [Synechococcaceae cyanobacterium SM2_3_1]